AIGIAVMEQLLFSRGRSAINIGAILNSIFQEAVVFTWGLSIMIQPRLPTGPKGNWLSGNLPDFRQQRLEFFARCAREYGDMVKLRLAHRSIYLVSHPDAIEEVLLTQSKNFIKHFA